MKYEFMFKEVNYGRVVVEADALPAREDVVEAIESGAAFYKGTEYLDIEPSQN